MVHAFGRLISARGWWPISACRWRRIGACRWRFVGARRWWWGGRVRRALQTYQHFSDVIVIIQFVDYRVWVGDYAQDIITTGHARNIQPLAIQALVGNVLPTNSQTLEITGELRGSSVGEVHVIIPETESLLAPGHDPAVRRQQFVPRRAVEFVTAVARADVL